MTLMVGLVSAFFAGLAPEYGHAAPNGFEDHPFNGRAPEHRNGVTTFHVKAGDCSNVPYMARYPATDCYNGNIRSRMAYRTHFRLGDAVEYSMEILVPQGFRFDGGTNPRSSLEIAEWQRIQTIKNHIHTLHLDSRRGVTFDDAPCIAPSEFGRWSMVRVQVLWSMGDDGRIVVTCNDRVVLSRIGRTAIPPDCASPRTVECDPATQEPEQPIQMQVGLLHRGYGQYHRERGISSARRLPPPEGFTVQFRNVKVRRIRFR